MAIGPNRAPILHIEGPAYVEGVDLIPPISSVWQMRAGRGSGGLLLGDYEPPLVRAVEGSVCLWFSALALPDVIEVSFFPGVREARADTGAATIIDLRSGQQGAVFRRTARRRCISFIAPPADRSIVRMTLAYQGGEAGSVATARYIIEVVPS